MLHVTEILSKMWLNELCRHKKISKFSNNLDIIILFKKKDCCWFILRGWSTARGPSRGPLMWVERVTLGHRVRQHGTYNYGQSNDDLNFKLRRLLLKQLQVMWLMIRMKPWHIPDSPHVDSTQWYNVLATYIAAIVLSFLSEIRKSFRSFRSIFSTKYKFPFKFK